MASARTRVRMKRGGKYHPPGSIFHDFDESEIERLGTHVERLDGAEDALGTSQTATGAPIDLPPPDDDETGRWADDGGAHEGESRIAQIRDGIDLLDGSDFTAAGRPKVQPLTDVLGFKPTADEITTALALREEEGL